MTQKVIEVVGTVLSGEVVPTAERCVIPSKWPTTIFPMDGKLTRFC